MTMTNQPPIYAGRIIQDPAILSGKPVVSGTRIPVHVVLEISPTIRTLMSYSPTTRA